MTESFSPMSVRDAVGVLQAERDDALVVLTMSAIAYWSRPSDDDYRLMGLMGAAGSIGLGLAIGAPERDVWVLDGDGSLLMQFGVLAAIADAAPGNLTHIIFDNGIYAISGGQPTPSSLDWPATLRAVGYADVAQCTTATQLRDAVHAPRPRPRGIVAHCESRRPDYPPGAFAVEPAKEAARLRRALASPVG
jgi:phosphonopyruvate decarboxylase